jgi:prophage maintenance system killer protein
MCIKMVINTNKIIKINRRYGGSLINRSNLDFDVRQANQTKNIYKSNAYIVRGIVVGHSFLDGNKRTAINVITNRFKNQNISCDKKALTRGIVNIAKNNVSNVNHIERRLRKWCSVK